MNVDPRVIRSRIRNANAAISQTLHTQKALGGWRYRQTYHETDRELTEIAFNQENELRKDTVRLLVLRAAVDSNRLIRWLVERWTRSIAKAVDG